MNSSVSKFLFLTLTLCLFTVLNVSAKETKRQPNTTVQLNPVDQYVEGIMKRHGIPGAAVAILKDNQIIHENYYGYANLEHQVPVQAKTIFPLLSTSKIPVVTAVFKLVEEEKISLQDPLGKYLKDLPQEWKSIEIKYLLSHASGLPDLVKYDKDDEATMKNKLYKDAFIFNTGESFNYNQTNFWLLARIIEQVSGENFETHLLNQQFNTGNHVALFSTNMLEIIPNRASRYTYFNDRKQFEVDQQINGEYLNSCNGLNLSLPTFIEWSNKFANNTFIQQKTKHAMWQKFNYSDSGPEFAYGWEIHDTNSHLSYGFSGGYTTAFRTYPSENITIIWLTNGFNKFYSTDTIVNYLAGLVEDKLQSAEAIAVEKVSQSFFEKTIENARKEFHHIKNQHPDVALSNTLHTIASGFMDDDRIEDSLSVHNLNISEHPDNWLGYYGRANAYKKKLNMRQAITDYKKAAELNTDDSQKAQLNKLAADLQEPLTQDQ